MSFNFESYPHLPSSGHKLQQFTVAADEGETIKITFSTPGDEDTLPYTATLHYSQAYLLSKLLKFVATVDDKFEITSKSEHRKGNEHE